MGSECGAICFIGCRDDEWRMEMGKEGFQVAHVLNPSFLVHLSLPVLFAVAALSFWTHRHLLHCVCACSYKYVKAHKHTHTRNHAHKHTIAAACCSLCFSRCFFSSVSLRPRGGTALAIVSFSFACSPPAAVDAISPPAFPPIGPPYLEHIHTEPPTTHAHTHTPTHARCRTLPKRARPARTSRQRRASRQSGARATST